VNGRLLGVILILLAATRLPAPEPPIQLAPGQSVTRTVPFEIGRTVTSSPDVVDVQLDALRRRVTLTAHALGHAEVDVIGRDERSRRAFTIEVDSKDGILPPDTPAIRVGP
jgi:hypothetical protein